MQEEKLIDVKGTLEKFIIADEPEMSQEEAISKFQEKDLLKEIRKNTSNANSDDTQNSMDQEHIERIKNELLASLERVKKLEKQIYGENKIEEKAKLKVKAEQIKQQTKMKDENQTSRKTQIQKEQQKER